MTGGRIPIRASASLVVRLSPHLEKEGLFVAKVAAMRRVLPRGSKDAVARFGVAAVWQGLAGFAYGGDISRRSCCNGEYRMHHRPACHTNRCRIRHLLVRCLLHPFASAYETPAQVTLSCCILLSFRLTMPGATIVVSLAASAFAILGALAAPHPGPSSLIASGAPLSARDQLGFRCQGANTFTLDGTHTQTCASCLVCKEGVGCAWPDDSGTCGGGASASSGEEATTIVEANETTAVASPAAESTIALKQNAVVSVVESDTGEDDCQDEVEETGATGASPTPTPTPTPTPGGTGSPTDGTAAAESTLDLQRNAVVTGTPGEGEFAASRRTPVLYLKLLSSLRIQAHLL